MKIYRGRLAGSSWDEAVVEIFDHVEVGPPGNAVCRETPRGPLTHHSKHSPSGFAWGYAGSGPSELARCLLIDHLGDKAPCPTCEGIGSVTYGDVDESSGEPITRPARVDDEDGTSCPTCWGEKFMISPRTYQAFKFEFVAGWSVSGWEITSEEIDAWLTTQPATV